MTIKVDMSEPTDIIRMIEPVMPVEVLPLNSQRWADYVWTGESISHWPKHNGFYQLERKTWADLAAGSGLEEIEDQLREQYRHHPEAMLRLVIEGNIEPHPAGALVYSRARGKDLLTSRLMGRTGSFLSILGKVAGWYEFLDVYQTASYPATASLIVELYKRDQKPEENRTTFAKHYKTMTWHQNPQVARLLGLAWRDANIGPEKAEAMIAKFGTVWAVASASPKELATVRGVSVEGATLFLRKIGRLDV